MSKPDRSIELLAEVIKTCHAIGFEKTLESTKQARENYCKVTFDTVASQKERSIINAACKIVNISYDDLMKKDSQKPSRTTGLIILCVYFRVKKQYSLKAVARIFGFHHSNISHRVNNFLKLSAQNKHDKIIIDQYELLVKNIKEQDSITS